MFYYSWILTVGFMPTAFDLFLSLSYFISFAWFQCWIVVTVTWDNAACHKTTISLQQVTQWKWKINAKAAEKSEKKGKNWKIFSTHTHMPLEFHSAFLSCNGCRMDAWLGITNSYFCLLCLANRCVRVCGCVWLCAFLFFIPGIIASPPT